MKFHHSPSSSSTTEETRLNYGCIPAVLRRLLCFHTLPTFPNLDNHIEESYVNNQLCCADNFKGNPGIVGKLMGLDSMPAVNAIDEWRELKMQRKLGNYVFKAPAFVELENEKFIILSFEGGGKDKELPLNCSRTRKGLIVESNQDNPICDQGLESHVEVVNSCKLSNLGKNSKKTECIKRRGLSSRKKKIETESDSENSSPVSVLEFSDHQESSSYSGKGDDLQSKNSNSRRKLREDLEKNAAPAPSSSLPGTSSCNSVNGDDESCRNGKEYIGLEKKNFTKWESKGMWDEICKMTERDVMDSSRVERWKGEDFEEIGVCFELHILDQLILELFTF